MCSVMSKGAETRATIVQEALDEASIIGLSALSIGQLAKRTGLSKSGLFAHFGSKESLQLAVLQEVVDRFVEHVVLPALKKPSGEERLRALISNWIAWGAAKGFQGGCPLMAASIEFDDQPGAIHDYVYQHQRLWLNGIERMAQKAIEDGAFDPNLDVEQFAFEFNAIGLGLNYALRLHKDAQAKGRAEIAFERLIQSAKAVSAGS